MPDRLSGHHGPLLDIAVHRRAAQCSGPEMLDFELCRLAAQTAGLEAADNFGLMGKEPLGALVHQTTHRNDRKAIVELGSRAARRARWRG